MKDVGESASPTQPDQTRHVTRVRVHPLPPRGLCRVQAAAYIGVSPTTFDGMIADGIMPKPKRVRSRVIWDLKKLDAAFEALPGDEEANPWDAGE